MQKLQEKAKTTFVKIEPSRIGQPYKYIELKCVCCRKTFFKGDIREDPDKVTGQEKPLCPNCAKHHLERLNKWKEKLLSFKEWLEKTEWRGVSSEVYEEFKERFGELLK